MNGQSEATKIICQPRSAFALHLERGFLSHYSFELPATTNPASKIRCYPLNHHDFQRRFCILVFSLTLVNIVSTLFMPSTLILFSCSKKLKFLAKGRPVEFSDKTAHKFTGFHNFCANFGRPATGFACAIRFGKLIAWLR